MAQAKKNRAKKHTAHKSPKKNTLPIDLPWGLMFWVFLLLGVIGVLFYGALRDDVSMGSGLKKIWDQRVNSQNADPEIAELIQERGVPIAVQKKEFDYHRVLPDIQQVMPTDIPLEWQKKKKKYDYYVQVASFKAHSDAEKLRIRLASKGYSSITQKRKNAQGASIYRVRLGPYRGRRKAKNAKSALQKLGVNPLIYPVKR